MRKRIGILAAQIEENTQNRFLKAFLTEAYAYDYDICIFSMYQKYQETGQRNVGDSNIYKMIQFDRFDGLIILADSIQTPGLEEKLLRLVKTAYSGPVIVVDKETDLFEYVLMDHYSPLVELTNHLIEVHGYRDFAYLSGKKGHPHSIQRLNGFLDALKNHGLSIDESRIYHANYWYDGGRDFANILLADREHMPRCVVCANDCMAIGLAARLSDAGLRIPEDVAVTGYDSIEPGRLSPVPLTSAEIPAPACGKICFYKLHSAISGEPMPDLELKADILIGGSCGCTDFETAYVKVSRDSWATDHSTVSYYSDFNHLTEDMLCQTKTAKFFEVLAKYAYQIRPFDDFWLLLNDGYEDPSEFIGDNARRTGYANQMHIAIHCGQNTTDFQSCVDLKSEFDTSMMLPALYAEREKPATFIFTPLFFEDISFGYAALKQTDPGILYTETFRIWMRNINLGIEAFYRQKAMVQLLDQVKADQIRDKLTGLYNYQGFHKHLTDKIRSEIGSKKTLSIIVIDLDNLKGINEQFGRSGGDNAIRSLSMFLSFCVNDNEICGRLGNDEFLIGLVEENSEERCEQFEMLLPEEGLSFHDSEGRPQYFFTHHAMITTTLGEMPDLDFMINQAINANNHKKQAERTILEEHKEISPEMAEMCRQVNEILDESLLTYHFQPIVRVADGEIYGYEALMRYEGEHPLKPMEILHCAETLNRMYDIEKATFGGVLNYLDEHSDEFGKKKVFINSLPGHQLKGEDAEIVTNRMKAYPERIVVEYTEGSELSDEDICIRNKVLKDMHIELALDDYGSGYSNVNNLLRYMPRYVKIDHMLISGIQNDAQKRHFVSSIIEYAGKNNILVLAEGVETMEELRTVISLGVDLIQGFYTAKPSATLVERIDDTVRSQIKRFNYFSFTG